MVFYLAILSSWSFILVLLGIIATLVYFINSLGKTFQIVDLLSQKNADFFEKLSDILNGYKEIKVNKAKRKGVLNDYGEINDERRSLKIELGKRNGIMLLHSLIFLYGIVAIIVFIVPVFHTEHAATLIKITAAILFLFGPMENVLNSIYFVVLANHSSANIIALEKELDRNPNGHNLLGSGLESGDKLTFDQNIHFRNLTYTYPNADGTEAFSIGPFDLTINKGEIIFITGGNGSGKSTFLKMFTGLYFPTYGNVYLDSDIQNGRNGTCITKANYDQYRELFTLIFTDFHLFSKLYGAENIAEETVNQLLVEMDLPKEKTSYKNGRFTNIRLSSGQKKRIALITSIIENKEIYIFDEVASDLDPEFRDTYYYELLPQLKAYNKTIFVVSHDKSYWDAADRLLELRQGQLFEIQHKPTSKINFEKEESFHFQEEQLN